jgi:hypothetical protein
MLDEILRRLDRLEAKRPASEPTRADDIVDADYFARRTGLSRETILRGKAGTKVVPLQSKRPRTWLKRDVDAFVRQRAEDVRPAKQKALKLLDRSRGRRLR